MGGREETLLSEGLHTDFEHSDAVYSFSVEGSNHTFFFQRRVSIVSFFVRDPLRISFRKNEWLEECMK